MAGIVENNVVKMEWSKDGWLQTSAKKGKPTFILASKDYTNADGEGYVIREDKVTVSKTFMFDNIECLHEIRYRAIRDEDDNIKCYEKHVIC